MHDEVPRYEELQEETARATETARTGTILELGVGTGENLAARPRPPSGREPRRHRRERGDVRRSFTARRRSARLAARGSAAGRSHSTSSSRASAIHHLDGTGKRDLFGRIARHSRGGGMFVLADVIVPEDPADAVTARARRASTSPIASTISSAGSPRPASTPSRRGCAATSASCARSLCPQSRGQTLGHVLVRLVVSR